MTAAPDRNYRGQTAQARVADRRQQLLDAAVELLGTQGAQGLTMSAAARTAGLSPRFFYESFGDRDDLVAAAFDATLARLRSTAFEAIERTGSIREGFDAGAALIERDPRVSRILFREALAVSTLRAHAERQIHGFFETALAAVGALPEEPGEPPFRTGAVAGALIYLFLEWAEGRLGTDRTAFADYCAHVIDRLLD